MLSERFCLLMRWNGINFGQDGKVEFKKSFELYRQILLDVFYKSWLKFYTICIDKSKQNEANFILHSTIL